MKGLFIPDITAEMFRNGCLESIEALMAEGEIYDIDYEPERKGHWIEWCDTSRLCSELLLECSECDESYLKSLAYGFTYCPNCGADMRGDNDECTN